MRIKQYLILILLILNHLAQPGFAPDTLVQTPAGSSQIQELQTQDLVHSCQNNLLILNHVTYKRVTTTTKVLKIELENNSVLATPSQLFYSPATQKWVMAQNLLPTDLLLSSTGQLVTIKKIQTLFGVFESHDISVANSHTYYVSKDSVLVHNFDVYITWVIGEKVFKIAQIGFSIFGGLASIMFHKENDKYKLQPKIDLDKLDQQFGSGGRQPDDEDKEKRRSPNIPPPPKKDEKKAEIFEPNSKHMFREKEGHLPDTIENRNQIIETASNPKNLLGTDIHGNQWYSNILPDGKQIWASVKENKIRNCGVNNKPRPFNHQTGLCRGK